MKGNLQDLRQNYTRAGLLEEQAPAHPLALFGLWFHEALECGVTEPNAMSLATVDRQGRPRVRTVLLKDYSEAGFSYYTNLSSIKSEDTKNNPSVSVLFPWIQMERQVRIDGEARLLDRAAVDAYFKVRPRESQLGAWASEQSRSIDSRQTLEQRFAQTAARFEGREVPTPPFWGGFLISPTCIEFWQGRPGRLHDRLEYRLLPTGEWKRQRLQP